MVLKRLFEKRRFPHVEQHDAMQCGVASIAIISQYYGRKVSLDSLEGYCHPGRNGVSLKGISDAAKSLGFETFGCKLPVGQLSNDMLPCILHWNQNHFVVLYHVDSHRNFHVSDPAAGKVKYSEGEFRKNWESTKSKSGTPNGVALLLSPTEKFTKTAKESTRNLYARDVVRTYIRKYRGMLWQIFAGLILASLLQLMLPFLTQLIVDKGIRENSLNIIWLILLGELFIIIGQAATGFIRSRLLLHISMRVNISLISEFFIKLIKLPMDFFESKLTGDLLQRMSDHSRIQTFLTRQTLSTVFSILNLVIFGIVLAVYDLRIFVIFLAGSIGYVLWVGLFMKARKKIDYRLFELGSINQSKTFQFMTAMQEIKLQRCERRRRWEWEDIQADLFEVQMKSLKLEQTQQGGSILINEITNIVITAFAASSVINGYITLGAMMAIQYIIGQLHSPIDQLMGFRISLQDMKISLERINDIHKRKPENSGHLLSPDVSDKSGIVFQNVCFKYNPHGKQLTLDDISLTIPAGRITAIVGASGSGKTTLVKMMLGYYPPLDGSILLGEDNLNEVNLEAWRSNCGIVMQESVIFTDSIARNIAIEDDEIDMERVQQAAAIANISEFIESLPLKYDTIIGPEGMGCSKGQQQRLLIARAVYKNPRFLFLDEATNSLDATNEREIVESLQDYFKGRTVVVVAHRLSTVCNADNIVVLDHGRIVETGDHKSLCARKGYYYSLIKNQLELGQ